MEKSITDQVVKSIALAVPLLIRFPEYPFQTDYDKDADVLYISFQRPQKATDTIITDDGILLRYRDDLLVGITISDASARHPTDPLSDVSGFSGSDVTGQRRFGKENRNNPKGG